MIHNTVDQSVNNKMYCNNDDDHSFDAWHFAKNNNMEILNSYYLPKKELRVFCRFKKDKKNMDI
ncbi:hypothetical protein DERP_005406 [Dermatophagoides pteronyssinus]|uniref:Uncharacterized protein n=1 Tax=Dermatophagoides pteronyssinus TaxID=6956 RepID=A0ABQ8JMQ7_DERPT|nr:hypothetical protein DERP_005406 [Dermatophagoides pteronyssinus]